VLLSGSTLLAVICVGGLLVCRNIPEWCLDMHVSKMSRKDNLQAVSRSCIRMQCCSYGNSYKTYTTINKSSYTVTNAEAWHFSIWYIHGSNELTYNQIHKSLHQLSWVSFSTWSACHYSRGESPYIFYQCITYSFSSCNPTIWSMLIHENWYGSTAFVCTFSEHMS
jgi:hypothetical protein